MLKRTFLIQNILTPCFHLFYLQEKWWLLCTEPMHQWWRCVLLQICLTLDQNFRSLVIGGVVIRILVIKSVIAMCTQTWNLSKNLHRRIFRLKILHRQYHLISTFLVGKNTKHEWKWRNLQRWQKFYAAAGSDGMDKIHLCVYLKKSSEKVMVAEEVAREREVAAGQKQRKEIQLQVNKKSSSLDYEKL